MFAQALGAFGSSMAARLLRRFEKSQSSTHTVRRIFRSGGQGAIVRRVLSGAPYDARGVRRGVNVSPDILPGNQQHADGKLSVRGRGRSGNQRVLPESQPAARGVRCELFAYTKKLWGVGWLVIYLSRPLASGSFQRLKACGIRYAVDISGRSNQKTGVVVVIVWSGQLSGP